MSQRVNKKPVLGHSPYEHPGHIHPFDEVFTGGSQDVKEKGFDGVDAVLLWGGRDIPPQWYGQEKNLYSGAPDLPSERDKFEKKVVLYCKANNIPLIGVCRGAQFLCVMAGGSLIQHVDGHGYSHGINLLNNQHVLTTSTHHQMMFPYKVPHTLLGWTDTPRATTYQSEKGKNVSEMYQKPEPEIVFFPQLRGLAIQGHPEYSTATPEFIRVVNNLVKEYILPPF